MLNMNTLNQLRQYTTVVADTGDLDAIRQFRPLDATTNPSLITQASKQVHNQPLLDDAYQQASREGYVGDALLERTIDVLTVKLGVEILQLIDGRVSTEVDANLSYDTQATIDKALELLAIYESYGIDKQRILIKIAGTWQGIQAAKYLEQQGIHCNLTLIFGIHQAQACADAQVTLISPFVGRISDWQKKHLGQNHIAISDDAGVKSVQNIYTYYKQQQIQTQIMGASFRSIEQILALSGCDLLTIAPSLLQELNQQNISIAQAQLSPEIAQAMPRIQREPQTEETFDAELQADPMASELLQAGIQGFIQAKQQLLDLLKERYSH